MQNNDSKAALRRFMQEENMDTQAIANAISALTCRSYSVRTVQAWLADDKKMSNRNCPKWVVELMEKNRTNVKNQS